MRRALGRAACTLEVNVEVKVTDAVVEPVKDADVVSDEVCVVDGDEISHW
jgi:pyruvate carboxylase